MQTKTHKITKKMFTQNLVQKISFFTLIFHKEKFEMYLKITNQDENPIQNKKH